MESAVILEFYNLVNSNRGFLVTQLAFRPVTPFPQGYMVMLYNLITFCDREFLSGFGYYDLKFIAPGKAVVAMQKQQHKCNNRLVYIDITGTYFIHLLVNQGRLAHILYRNGRSRNFTFFSNLPGIILKELPGIPAVLLIPARDRSGGRRLEDRLGRGDEKTGTATFLYYKKSG